MLPKTQLQKLCERNLWNPPEYSNLKEGPEHKPCFTTTVTVNGVSFRSSNPCGTLKAAQNSAAELALNQFPVSESDSGSKKKSSTPTSLPSDRGHLYKSRLLNYLQKKNLSFPEYSFERHGPPHALCFKCKVTVCGQTYESREFFLSMREAENAAAKIAFDQLSGNEVQEVDFGLHKTALQELAHKRGFLSPSYKTGSYGPGHSLTFLSTVTVNEKDYQGLPARSKKLAEVNAAQLAFNSLQDSTKAMICETQLENPCVVSKESIEQTATNGKRPRSPTQCENVLGASEEEATINMSLHKILVYPRPKVPKGEEN